MPVPSLLLVSLSFLGWSLLEDAERAAEWFRAKILGLADGPESDRA